MGRSSEMMTYFFHFLLVAVAFAELGTEQYECQSKRCGHGPAIRFPFRLKGQQQAEQCGYPGFDLSCNDKKQTVLELPSSVNLLVKNINYKSQQIQLYDQHNCLPKHFPCLHISASPFQFQPDYYHNYDSQLINYTYFNCSSNNLREGDFIPCLSSPSSYVYAFISDLPISFSLPFDCTKISNFSFPELLFVYYERAEYVLHLNWPKPICQNCELQGKPCRLTKSNNSSMEPETECVDIPKPPNRGSKTTKEVVTGVILGFFLLVLVIILVYRLRRSDKIEKENQAKIETFLEDYIALKPTRYSYADIKRITNQFKEKLGEGGYGTVFKGKLSSEILVAVKILHDSIGNGDDFINEVKTMGTIHHVNVVRLVGFCADRFKRALVYEFLPKESLDKFIFSVDDRKRFLGWEKLQDIAVGIAKGIEYLHQGCNQRILHFDIKPHNILLDNNLNPKISDFGLAKLCSKEKSAVSMTAARGTMGYIAPEVLSRNFGNVSSKSDVYSFGMLMLEMVGGRKNIDDRVQNPSQVCFPEWIYNRLNHGEELQIRIEEEGDGKIAKKLTIVGLWCIQWYPGDRPSMNIVVQMLEGDGDNLTVPPNPFTSTIQTNSTAIMLGRPFNRELADIPELQ